MCKLLRRSSAMRNASRVICLLSCAGVLMAASLFAFSQAPVIARQLDFTRPTLVAKTIQAPASWHEVIFEDRVYIFVSRHYGNGGGQIPGLFVFSKTRNAWLEVLQLSTEHARLGRSPDFNDIALSVGWDYGPLVNRDYARLPLTTSGSINFPDRIVGVNGAAAYRFDFNSRLNREESLTSFWVRAEDLEAAFDGPLPTPSVPEGLAVQTDTILLTVVRLNDLEPLIWLVDSASDRTYADSQQHGLDMTKGDVSRSLSIQETEWANAPVTPMRNGMRENQALGGILGAPFFRHFAVTIDYDNERMSLDARRQFESGTRNGAILELLDDAPVLRVPIALSNGRVLEARLLVETGRSHGVVLEQAFIVRNKVSLPANAVNVAEAFRMEGGVVLDRAAISFGRFVVRDFPVTVSSGPQPDAVNRRVDGSIGNGLLRRFRITIDQQKGQLRLEPSLLFDVPYDYDLTGFTITRNGRSFVIGWIRYGGIAVKAGLRAGDAILQLDGKPVADMRLEELRSSFRHDGRDRSLTINRADTQRTIVLKMQTIP
jgi:PDZ domain-containing protein